MKKKKKKTYAKMSRMSRSEWWYNRTNWRHKLKLQSGQAAGYKLQAERIVLLFLSSRYRNSAIWSRFGLGSESENESAWRVLHVAKFSDWRLKYNPGNCFWLVVPPSKKNITSKLFILRRCNVTRAWIEPSIFNSVRPITVRSFCNVSIHNVIGRTCRFFP